MSTDPGRQTAGERAAEEYTRYCQQPSYGLCRLRRCGSSRLETAGRLDCDTMGIGLDLAAGVLWAAPGLLPGFYAVRCRTHVFRHRLPDWGCLLIRGPGSWVLRRRDGGEVILPDGSGGGWSVDMGGGGVWL
jgi:hypothetical protein